MFLFFAAHVIHLFLLLPIHTGRRDLLDRMLGLEYGDPTRETAAAMIKRLRHGRMGATAWTLLLAHAALLVVNVQYDLLQSELAINGSIAVLAWSTSLAGARRREVRPS